MSETGRTLTDCIPERPTQSSRIGPTNPFIEFRKEEVEQSIPDRFEKIVRTYSDHLAVKTRNYSLTYEELNKAANRVAHLILDLRKERQEPVALLFGQDEICLGILQHGCDSRTTTRRQLS